VNSSRKLRVSILLNAIPRVEIKEGVTLGCIFQRKSILLFFDVDCTGSDGCAEFLFRNSLLNQTYKNNYVDCVSSVLILVSLREVVKLY
jgi:hypothetical protein